MPLSPPGAWHPFQTRRLVMGVKWMLLHLFSWVCFCTCCSLWWYPLPSLHHLYISYRPLQPSWSITSPEEPLMLSQIWRNPGLLTPLGASQISSAYLNRNITLWDSIFNVWLLNWTVRSHRGTRDQSPCLFCALSYSQNLTEHVKGNIVVK